MDGIDNGHLTENKSENVADVNGNAGISDSVNSQDTVRQRVIESFGEYLGNPISLTRLKLRAQSTAGNSQLDATHSELSHLAENFRLVCDDACVLQEEDELVLTIPDNSTAILRKRLFHALDRDNGSLVWANVDRELQPIAGYAYGVPENDDDLWEMYIAAGENLSVASTENIKGSKYGDSPFDGSVPRKFIGKGRDQLTGLLTADEFRRRTEIFIKDEERSENLACVYFGFDNFSAYNEAYGYKAGDTLLRETAITISSVFPGSLISRISNTHMCVLCLQDKAAENANEVCNTINRHNVGSKSRIVLKAGIYIITSQSENIDSCCGKAKLAYYRNFNHYDKMFSIYDNKQNEENKERQYIIDNLERAIASQSIVTAYQPIIRSTTGEVHCLEVLARWNDPKKGIIPPNKFVQVCESAHIIHLLDAHVITMACRDWRSMVDAGYTPVGISINISRLDAQLCDIVEVIDRAVIENSIPRRLVHIEITETMLSDVTESLREAMDELRNKGYSLWMDDYGSGYSSLETLANYKFDLVKLDKSLLKQATDTSRSGIVLSSTIDMAKQLGMHTLCEGVETEQHAKLLREIGCEFQQGFLYSRPLYLDELKEKIDSGELVIEDPMWEGYSNAASNVNVLSTNPFSNSGKLDHGSKITMQDPLAIIERIPGEGLRFLVKDPAFEQMAKDEGFASPEEALRTIIADQPYTAERFQAMLDPEDQTDHPETYNFTFHNKHFLCTARRLATKDGRVELLLSLKPDTSSTTIGSDGEKTLTEQTQLPILEVYNEILVLDREANTVKIVYRHDTRFDQSFSGTVDQAYAFERIESYVHPESLERFRAFIDPDTLDSRFSRMEGHYLSDPFQIKTKKGGYIWQTFILIPALVSGHKSVMICIRDSNIDVIRRVSAPGELISDDQLWKAISNSKDIGLFWKDKNQRFLGMNDTMMSYYNIDSVSSILGKNNEEVGLYPDPKPLESEEAAVLKDGKEVRGLSGTCVASGRLRPIEMNLAPVYDNGTISGILGYSINVDGNSDDTSSNLELLQTDETTGCLNALGLFSNGSAYCSLARNSGSDVVLVESEIENIGYLDRVFGQELVKDLAKKIATDLQNEFGTNGVVARTSRNRFCVCTSIANSDEAEKVSDTIQQIIEAPRNVGAADMQPHTFMAHALFSETKSFEDMYSLVERRIDDARANTQRDKDSDYVASVTTNELIHMMRMLEKTFDIVRIVNPTASEASELSKNSDELEVPYCCYTTWDRTEPCVNCISAKAVSRRMSQSKYEQFDGSIFYIVSQPILVDGKMMALEIGFALRTDAAGPDYKISRVFNMSEEEASKYRDEATRAYNRRFYDEELSSLIGSKIALVGINRFDELNAKFGFHASDTVMESIVNTLMGHTRIRDLVIHFSSDQALVIFDSAIPSNVFADRLILIRQSIDNTKLADYPDIHPDVTISAVDSARYVSDLVAKAEQQLDKARETGEKVALFSGSLVQESNEEK